MMMAPGVREAPAEHVVELPEPWRSAAVTVVLPTYNEAANLPVIVAELLALPLPGAVRVRQLLRPRAAAARHPRCHRGLQDLAELRAGSHRRGQHPQQRLQLPGRDELPDGPARAEGRRAAHSLRRAPGRREQDEPARA